MIHDMTYAVQGALRQEKRFDILSNHLANTSTTGFKAQTMSFDEMLEAHMNIDHTQGDLLPTDNALDVAISGDGYFKIQTDQGIRYTRSGNFTLDPQGVLITHDGDAVLSTGGTVTIDTEEGGEIAITEEGEIEVDGSVVGKLAVVDFENPDQLQKEGDSLFAYTGDEADEITPEQSTVVQGSLEQSNVEVMVEMTRMIETNRLYESFQKLIQTIDDLNSKAISDVGVVR